MAFNPLHSARKHQKVIFALLTIMCMGVFVLTGASGTFMEIINMVSGRASGATVASLYGHGVTERELQTLRTHRNFANRYMLEAVSVANDNAARQVADGLKTAKIDKQMVDRLQEMLQIRSFLLQSPQFADMYYRENNSFSFGGMGSFQQNLGVLGFIRQSLAGEDKKADVQTGVDKKADIQLVDRMEELLKQDRAFWDQLKGGGYYFGGSTDTKDLLNFMIWKHQADRLGIQLKAEDVAGLVRRETNRMLTSDDSGKIFRGLRDSFGGGIDQEIFRKILADEFRVRMAQEALLGFDSKVYDRIPEPVTPFGLWQFYEKVRTESEIALLPVPVDFKGFLEKVPQPTKEELKEFFEKNKDREADSGAELPGFKKPARIQVEWVGARPDMPYFRQAAEVTAALTRQFLPVAFHAKLKEVYDREKFNYLAPSYARRELYLRDTTKSALAQPKKMAALAVQAQAMAATQGPAALAALVALQSAIIRQEMTDRIRMGAEVLLAPTQPSVLSSIGVAADVYQETELLTITIKTDPMPLESIQDAMIDKWKESLVKDLMKQGMDNLRNELSRHGREKPADVRKVQGAAAALGHGLAFAGAPGMALAPLLAADPLVSKLAAAQDKVDEARAAVALALGGGGSAALPAALTFHEEQPPLRWLQARVEEAIHRIGLEHGSTDRPRDLEDIAEKNSGLDSLKKAFFRRELIDTEDAKADKKFANLFFDRTKGLTSSYFPEELQGSTNDTTYLYWKTGDRPGYVPEFAAVEKKVRERWLLEKARKYAQEAAEKVAAEARKAGGDAEKNLKDAAAKYSEKLIFLPHVAPLVKDRPAVESGMREADYKPYTVPHEQVEYPTPDFAKKLLDMKVEGEVAVLHDKPEANYYVALVMRRVKPFENIFFMDARRPEPLLGRMEDETKFRNKYLKEFMAHLQADAKMHIDDEKVKGETPDRSTPEDE